MARRGPRTTRGKAASSRNALKHGFGATAPVVRQVESVEDWQYHLGQVIASIEPDGYLETEFAVRAAGILWRLRRIPRFEADKISIALDQMPDDLVTTARYGAKITRRPVQDITLEKVEMQTGIRMLPDGESLQKITRYEAHLHRQLIQTLHELEAMQARRKGESTPLARLDISGPPGS